MPTTHYSLRTLRSPVEGESRTLCNKDYVVISVVALVQGVRHAGGSPSPELVLAEAFGRHVETWNGRPLVVNHPVNAKGQAVLASSPDILESSYLGTLMGAKVEDGKLIVEAWLDVGAVEASESDSVIDMWKRLVSGETVEVSVGAIVYTKRGDGEFEGKKYSGSWDIVIPDHLAFLDGGQIGACSVEDGCGTFRTHSVGSVRLSNGVREKMRGALKTVSSHELYSPDQPRDKQGQWTSGGSDDSNSTSEENLIEVGNNKIIGNKLSTEQVDALSLEELQALFASGAADKVKVEGVKDYTLGEIEELVSLMEPYGDSRDDMNLKDIVELFKNGAMPTHKDFLENKDGKQSWDTDKKSWVKRGNKTDMVKGTTKRVACDCGDKKGLVAGRSDAAQVETGKAWARMLWNADTFDHDRRSVMQRALTDKFGSMKGSYVVTFNDKKVVYEQYDGNRFALYEMSYESDSENNIMLSGEPQEVVLQSKTVSVSSVQKEGKTMSKALQSLAAKSKKAEEEDKIDGGADEEDEDVNGNIKKKGTKKKMSSEVEYPTHIIALAEKLDAAETLEDIAKALEGSTPGKKLRAAMKVCDSARKQAIKVIRASTGGKGFTDDMLTDMSFEALQQTAVAFLAADRRAEEVLSADADLEEGGEELAEGEELEVEDEDEDGEVEGLSAIMDLEGQAERLNAPPPKKKVIAPAKTARLAAPGKASYGGRAAAGSGGHGRPPAAPNIFNFDDNGDFIGKTQKAS
jgi:hypothetical protein